ncbi:conjugative transposon protein TraK [Flavobacterium turcicum]|uniref:Conjugative transposon protein TraK n=1 Tax=Flavobacterium turcicum TaxID=2764718 RepID=A0ABR7JEE5_9FLAO|nr:conjugative transposon protein TraK [Flavobacterium turcicum]MBC5862873.1 conjugative transposon protein TraK [Flavobacterium turcicum]NHL01605.1 conjugative transposon protein TraK [Flavobacterium turcicum]
MFNKIKNIDTAFRHVRSFTMLVITGCIIISCFALYKSFTLVSQMQEKVYILANGKALEAYASDRKDNIPVEARDHVMTFHKFFFTLDPDDKVIKTNVTKALYMADESAKRIYDDLKENGYYAGIISGNVSQTIQVDSVTVDINEYPYLFRCYATQNIIRTTSIAYRSLITEGSLRNVSRSDNNPHGFLIEKWNTIENRDLSSENRK